MEHQASTPTNLHQRGVSAVITENRNGRAIGFEIIYFPVAHAAADGRIARWTDRHYRPAEFAAGRQTYNKVQVREGGYVTGEPGEGGWRRSV